MPKQARANASIDIAPLMTVQQVCDRTQLSASTIRRALKAGDLPHHMIGRVIRVSEANLQLFLSRSRSN